MSGKSIQIVVTSHSPMFISDLPKSNVIFLRRDKDTGLCKNVSSEVIDQPFAANIHSLYADSFFISDGMIGDIAKEKVIGVTSRLLNSERLTEVEIKEIQKTIELIGEPVWKLKLLEMLMVGNF